VLIVVGSIVAVLCFGGIALALVLGSQRSSARSEPPPVSGESRSGGASTAPTAGETGAPVSPALPADRTYTGRGSKVVKLALSDDHTHIATITHDGASNFAIWSVDGKGNNLDLIVNDIGSYKGVRPLDFVDTPVALKIEADGAWRVVVRVAEKAPLWRGKASGKGPAVYRVDPSALTGLPTVTFTHRGSSNFVVWSYDDGPELLINDIGRYSGETILPQGTDFVAIEADGAWTFAKG
jgi:hypothetical protein